MKILSQLQSPSGHEEAKNQDTSVQEALVADDDGEMSPSNDGGSVVPAEAETEWDQLGGRGQARDFAPIVELSSHTQRSGCQHEDDSSSPKGQERISCLPQASKGLREIQPFQKCAYDGITC